MMKSIVYARGDDWEGIYVDGQLKSEGHSVSLDDFATLVASIGPFQWEQRFVDLEWLEYEGRLPLRIESVKWETL